MCFLYTRKNWSILFNWVNIRGGQNEQTWKLQQTRRLLLLWQHIVITNANSHTSSIVLIQQKTKHVNICSGFYYTEHGNTTVQIILMDWEQSDAIYHKQEEGNLIFSVSARTWHCIMGTILGNLVYSRSPDLAKFVKSLLFTSSPTKLTHLGSYFECCRWSGLVATEPGVVTGVQVRWRQPGVKCWMLNSFQVSHVVKQLGWEQTEAVPPGVVWQFEPAVEKMAAAVGWCCPHGPKETVGKWEAGRPCLGWKSCGWWEALKVHLGGDCCLGSRKAKRKRMITELL